MAYLSPGSVSGGPCSPCLADRVSFLGRLFPLIKGASPEREAPVVLSASADDSAERGKDLFFPLFCGLSVDGRIAAPRARQRCSTGHSIVTGQTLITPAAKLSVADARMSSCERAGNSALCEVNRTSRNR